jgi:hypothetical protein
MNQPQQHLDSGSVRSPPGRRERVSIPPALQSIEIALDVGRRHRFKGLPAALQVAEEASRSMRIVSSNVAAVALFLQVLA